MLRASLLAVALLACKGGESKQAPASSSVPTPGSGSGSAAPVAPKPSSLPPAWAKVLGAKPGMRGTTLAAFRFGEPVDVGALPDVPETTWGIFGDVSRNIRLAPDGKDPKVRIDLEIRSGKLLAIDVELYTASGSIPEDSCAAFVTELEGMWGASPERVWADREGHARMSFRDTCKLRFEPYVDVATWIGPEPTAIVPVALVGKAAAELASRVDPEMSLEDGVTFRAAGLGESADGATTVDAFVKKGVIVGLVARASTSAAEKAAIRERISSAFKAQPARDPKTGVDVWSSVPPIRMQETKSGVRIEVGTLD